MRKKFQEASCFCAAFLPPSWGGVRGTLFGTASGLFNQRLAETVFPSYLQKSSDFMVWGFDNLGKSLSNPGSPRDNLQLRELRRPKALI